MTNGRAKPHQRSGRAERKHEMAVSFYCCAHFERSVLHRFRDVFHVRFCDVFFAEELNLSTALALCRRVPLVACIAALC